MLGASVRGRVRLRMGLADWQLVLGGARSRGMSLARGRGGPKTTGEGLLHNRFYITCTWHTWYTVRTTLDWLYGVSGMVVTLSSHMLGGGGQA